jgi:hypothetical protein
LRDKKNGEVLLNLKDFTVFYFCRKGASHPAQSGRYAGAFLNPKEIPMRPAALAREKNDQLNP